MRKIKWGVLGTAGIARKQTIPGMQQAENCELYAIAGRSLEKARQFQADFGFEKAYGSYEALLNDPEVEAVYIPLPNELHCEWTVKALRAHKHVLCEKPLAPNEAQVKEMIAAAEETGMCLMEAFAYLHSPYVAALKNEIASGVIGDVLYLESAFITPTPAADNIRMRRETYGGALYDLGCYTTSLATWLMGMEPEKVTASADFSDQGIDLYTSAILTYPGGARAALDSGMVLSRATGRIDRLQIHGTRGKILSDVPFNQPGELRYTVIADGKTEVKTVTARHNYALEVEQLGRCITDGEQPHVSHAFTLMNARVIDRILEKTGY